MANTMTTRVSIKNLNEETFEKLKSLMENDEKNKYNVDWIKNINMLYETEFTNENAPDYAFMEETVGAKWITIEGIDKTFSDEVELVIESAWHVPSGYLEKLAEYLTKFDKNIVLVGTYVEESLEPMGAFVYGHEYEDMEDNVETEIDHDKWWEDEEYRDGIYEELYDLRNNMFQGYLETMKEREEDENEEN